MHRIFEPIIAHVAIDSFAIQAERLRCPKLIGRPVALAPSDSSRPRVLVVSREAAAAGIVPGTLVIAARRVCRDLIALPPDPDLYSSLSDSIRDRLSPYAPLGPTARPGRFVLDMTGVARTHSGACDRVTRAGHDVERAFRLHPTLGVASTRLVSGIAAGVLAPDGELLDVPGGSEMSFLGPLRVSVLPSARAAAIADRLELLNIRVVRDLQGIGVGAMAAALGRSAAAALWRESRGLESAERRGAEVPPSAIAEETLAADTNDGRVIAARMERLAMEIGVGLRARRACATRLEIGVTYADARVDRARTTLADPECREAELRASAAALLARAVRRRVRVRRIRLAAWESAASPRQLTLWGDPPGEPALQRGLDRVRARFGTDMLVPASWMSLGVALRPSARP